MSYAGITTAGLQKEDYENGTPLGTSSGAHADASKYDDDEGASVFLIDDPELRTRLMQYADARGILIKPAAIEILEKGLNQVQVELIAKSYNRLSPGDKKHINYLLQGKTS